MVNAYKAAGVDIKAGYESVNRIKKHVERTKRTGLLGGFGQFGAMFDFSCLNMKEPVLISGTDGVGTKLKLAFMMDQHDTIGIDAVAMCVNDIIVHGAEPLYFLDYIACGKAVPERIEAIVKGIADGCETSGCALIGGETAEMPGLYEENEYDLAGFAVGAVEKSKIINGSTIQSGDVLVGLASSGIHSNGYSLVRKLLLDDAKIQLNDYIPEFQSTLGEELLKPTKIYVKSILAAIKSIPIKGMAHITGGGFFENIPRMIPTGLGAIIHEGSWEIPPIYSLMEKTGDLNHIEMYNIFNMGIGMVIAVSPTYVDELIDLFQSLGETPSIIGTVTESDMIQIVRNGDI